MTIVRCLSHAFFLPPDTNYHGTFKMALLTGTCSILRVHPRGFTPCGIQRTILLKSCCSLTRSFISGQTADNPIAENYHQRFQSTSGTGKPSINFTLQPRSANACLLRSARRSEASLSDTSTKSYSKTGDPTSTSYSLEITLSAG